MRRPRNPLRFQSSPGQKAGCNARTLNPASVKVVPRFQSSPGQKAGCNVSFMPRLSGLTVFQSSPGQKAGCNLPCGRWVDVWSGFNPHPARRPDAMHLRPALALFPALFQSSPGQKAGCNKVSMRSSMSSITMFQSSPGQKAGCNLVNSILPAALNHSFNPHPARRPDAIGGVACQGRMLCCSVFQSSPGQKAGCNWDPSRQSGSSGTVVSILTRPEGRMQSECARAVPPVAMFQSSPGQKAGCNHGSMAAAAWHWLFQSSPGQKAGCNVPILSHQALFQTCCFNPHPARRPDAIRS